MQLAGHMQTFYSQPDHETLDPFVEKSGVGGGAWKRSEGDAMLLQGQLNHCWQ